MMHKYYITNAKKTERDAFLSGCRTIMNVLRHAHPDEYGTILAREDADWILYLCDRERARVENEERKVARAIVQHYTVDRTRLRGMLLNRARINDDGRDIDEEGKVSGPRTYPRHYWNEYGIEISAADFALLTSEQQQGYEEVMKLELRSRIGDRIRYVDAYNRAIVSELISEMLPHEPKVLLRMYRDALSDDSNEVIQSYRDCFANILQSNNLSSSRLDFDFESWLDNSQTAKRIAFSQR